MERETGCEAPSTNLHEEHAEPGSNLADKLTQAIGACDAVIVLITANAVPSQFVNQEIGVALSDADPFRHSPAIPRKV